jgi:hypothetical protein
MFISIIFFFLALLSLFFAWQVYTGWWKKNGLIIGENYPIHFFLILLCILFAVIGITLLP